MLLLLGYGDSSAWESARKRHFPGIYARPEGSPLPHGLASPVVLQMFRTTAWIEATSSLTMVPTPVPSTMLAPDPTALLRFTEKVSLLSTAVSPLIVTEMVLEVSP